MVSELKLKLMVEAPRIDLYSINEVFQALSQMHTRKSPGINRLNTKKI